MTQNCRKWIRHASPEHALASPSNLFRRWCLLPSKGALLLSSSVFHSTFFQKLNDLLNITEDSVIHSMFFQKSNVLLNIKANPTRRSDIRSIFLINQREYQNITQQPTSQPNKNTNQDHPGQSTRGGLPTTNLLIPSKELLFYAIQSSNKYRSIICHVHDRICE